MSRLEAICCCYSFLPRIRGGGGGTSNTGEMGPVFADLRALLEKKKRTSWLGATHDAFAVRPQKTARACFGEQIFQSFSRICLSPAKTGTDPAG